MHWLGKRFKQIWGFLFIYTSSDMCIHLCIYSIYAIYICMYIRLQRHSRRSFKKFKYFHTLQSICWTTILLSFAEIGGVRDGGSQSNLYGLFKCVLSILGCWSCANLWCPNEFKLPNLTITCFNTTVWLVTLSHLLHTAEKTQSKSGDCSKKDAQHFQHSVTRVLHCSNTIVSQNVIKIQP